MKLLRIIISVIALFISQSALSQLRNPNIRSIDFTNFSYPWTANLGDPKKPFTLRSGKIPETRTADGLVEGMGVYLEEVSYGDVTGDGVEDALVSMSVLTGGSAAPGLVYVYTMRKNRPKLLWHFYTGDRANSGLRNVYADNGHLIVELNSPVGAEGDCCPTRFTRTRYEWRGNRFWKKRKETVPIPAS